MQCACICMKLWKHLGPGESCHCNSSLKQTMNAVYSHSLSTQINSIFPQRLIIPVHIHQINSIKHLQQLLYVVWSKPSVSKIWPNSCSQLLIASDNYAIAMSLWNRKWEGIVLQGRLTMLICPETTSKVPGLEIPLLQLSPRVLLEGLNPTWRTSLMPTKYIKSKCYIETMTTTAKCADNIRESSPACADTSAPTQCCFWQMSEHCQKYLVWNQTPRVCANIPTYTFVLITNCRL